MTTPISPLSTTAGTDSSDTSSSTDTSSAAAGTNGLLAPNQFLNLLVDSLKYQDPLDPTSSADFLTQLASLAQVQTGSQIAETDQTSAAANLLGDTILGSDAAGVPVTGVVSGFSLGANGPVLNVGSDSVSLGEITAVDDTAAASAATPDPAA